MKLIFLQLITACSTTLAQNLLINGDFEDVITKVTHKYGMLDSFYTRNWFTPTSSTVDIYCDTQYCDDNTIWNLEPILKYCLSTQSGKYCLGIGLINAQGWVEHITGRLSEPMQKGFQYSVSFYVNINGGNTYYSDGFGFKLSSDSILFNSEIQDELGLSPSYNDLFSNSKIYADYELQTIPINDSWSKVEYLYTASGGEKFITFGKFAYKEDRKKKKLFDKAMHRVNILNGKKLSRHYEKLGFRKVDLPLLGGDARYQPNSYYLDNVEIILVDSIARKDSVSSVKDYEYSIPANANHVDLDPYTTTPSQKHLPVDRGFVGDIKMELGVRLKPRQKYVLEYGKRQRRVIVCEGPQSNHFNETVYTFEYPARKLYKKGITIYVDEVDQFELDRLQKNCDNIEIINEPAFKGTLYRCKMEK